MCMVRTFGRSQLLCHLHLIVHGMGDVVKHIVFPIRVIENILHTCGNLFVRIVVYSPNHSLPVGFYFLFFLIIHFMHSIRHIQLLMSIHVDLLLFLYQIRRSKYIPYLVSVVE